MERRLGQVGLVQKTAVLKYLSYELNEEFSQCVSRYAAKKVDIEASITEWALIVKSPPICRITSANFWNQG